MMKQEKNKVEYDPFVIAQWIAASLTGELSGEEERKLAAWRESSAKHERLYGRLLNEENRRWKKQQFDSFDKESGWKGYKEKGSRERRISRGWIRFARYVAVLLVPLCVALYLWKGQTEDKSVLPVMASHTIEPGGAKASLILSTGDVVDLAATSGAIRVNDGMVIQNCGNMLSYQDTAGKVPTDSLMYNVVTVPKGGEYQLVLSDGTQVYLNSMTRIRYPVRFTGDTRDVELEGEAYFEVARNEGKPFVVRTACYDVTVLGTQFNVAAYRNDNMTSTTLVQGAVEVSGKGITEARRLRVDERFVLDKVTGKVTVEKVDVSYDTAWKDGKFRFRDVRLEDIMRDVERWYDVTVEYDGDEVKDFRFGFNMSRHETIEPLLRIFELNGKVEIERNGNILKVKRGR
ncbi:MULTISPECIES: FecR family protein [Butyricimonas]|uniref:FecR family protein n=1 Tax=Butyricimonas TaxID=574697 RepID=UPI001D07A091|nr:MULTISPECIES: FecR family protein [Butyricimonas]MCB6972297.1 FecR domain-containing protein [Butyricimonas synergistica]MCG4519140.1 FecR domain-containing protein [Butyricimonas sp. DFI.6.44]